MGETAETFGFSFCNTDAPSSIYKISMMITLKITIYNKLQQGIQGLWKVCEHTSGLDEFFSRKLRKNS